MTTLTATDLEARAGRLIRRRAHRLTRRREDFDPLIAIAATCHPCERSDPVVILASAASEDLLPSLRHASVIDHTATPERPTDQTFANAKAPCP
jgi:hypothetical protein